MASQALAKPWQDLKRAYAASVFARFFQWWFGELKQLLPVRWREALVDQPEELTVQLEPGAVSIRRVGADEALLTLAEDQDPAQRQAEIARCFARFQVPPRLCYRLSGERVLRRRLSLPLAAQENLRQVLGFELDRQTPFRADQVYYGSRILASDPVARQIAVELLLVPRALLDTELARIAAAGLALDAVDASDASGAALGVNLLPPERRALRRNWQLRFNLALGAAALALLLVVMYQSVVNREAALEQMRDHVDKAKREAHAVADLRRSLADAVEGANFLAERRRQQPVIIELLHDLNERLPDDTYLVRFSLNNGDIQLQGLSAEASKLVPILQHSQLLEGPAVQGAISPDPRTKKEQFVISAKPKLAEAPKRAHDQS
jgi:general secretion pathway protein L